MSPLTKNKLGEERFMAAFFSAPARVYRKGETLFTPDDPPTAAYFIEKGFVKDYSISLSGDEQLNTIFRAGDIFPIRLLLKTRPREAYFECLEETRVRILKKEQFEALIHDDPMAAAYVMSKLIDIVDMYELSVDSLTKRSANEKILSQLRAFARRFGRETDEGMLIDAPITHHDIANSTGLARETATRQLNQLRKKGLIAFKKRRFVITDPAKFQMLLLLQEHPKRILKLAMKGDGTSQQVINYVEQHPKRTMRLAVGLVHGPQMIVASSGSVTGLLNMLLVAASFVVIGLCVYFSRRRSAVA